MENHKFISWDDKIKQKQCTVQSPPTYFFFFTDTDEKAVCISLCTHLRLVRTVFYSAGACFLPACFCLAGIKTKTTSYYVVRSSINPHEGSKLFCWRFIVQHGSNLRGNVECGGWSLSPVRWLRINCWHPRCC